MAGAEAVDDESFALAEKLAEELDDTGEGGGNVEAEELDVENVFAQFKKGVEEQVGLDDSDTHFDLGIAYKEMGLYADAIGEFKLAMNNASRECIAQTMIGLCYVEQGMLSDAIKHFKKGLYAEAKTGREELGLYFELGAAYQMLNDPKEALYYLQKVQKRDPNFRGVEERIAQLTSPRAGAGPRSSPSSAPTTSTAPSTTSSATTDDGAAVGRRRRSAARGRGPVRLRGPARAAPRARASADRGTRRTRTGARARARAGGLRGRLLPRRRAPRHPCALLAGRRRCGDDLPEQPPPPGTPSSCGSTCAPPPTSNRPAPCPVTTP